MKKRPNIVIYNPDQFRADALGHLGNPVPATPNLDNFAKESMSFKNAYVQATVSTPSRISFLRGLYPYTTGNRTMHALLKDNSNHLLMTLKQAGYYVVWAGKNDFIDADVPESEFTDLRIHSWGNKTSPNAYPGKETSDDNNYYDFMSPPMNPEDKNGDQICNEEVLKFIKNYNGDKPFVIFMAYFWPHPPYIGFQKSIDKNLKTVSQWKRQKLSESSGKSLMIHEIKNRQNLDISEKGFDLMRATYMSMVNTIDKLFGQLISTLKEKKQFDNTGIFVFSDHGDFTGDFGLTEKSQVNFENCISNVPFLYKPPSTIKFVPGVKDDLVEVLDMYATALSLAEISDEQVETHFSKDLNKTVAKNKLHRKYAFSFGGRNTDELHSSEYINYKIGPSTQYYPRLAAQVESPEAHSKTIMITDGELKYIFHEFDNNELYNLKKDPREGKNLIDDKSYADKINEFKNEMLKHVIHTSDIEPKKLGRRSKDEPILDFKKEIKIS